MTVTTTIMPTDQLLLDPHNPRIGPDDGHSHDQEEVARRLGRSQNLNELVAAINNGSFRAPEPLLAREIDGERVIIDGNRRLLAIRIGSDPALARRLDLDHNLRELTEAAKADTRRIPVATFDDPLELHAVRITRQVTSVSGWRTTTSARDWQRLIGEGVPLETVAAWYHIHPTRLRQGLEAYLAFTQMQALDGEPKLTLHHFGLWREALQQGAIRESIGLPRQQGTDDGPAIENPIPAEGLDGARQLIRFLAGDQDRRRAVEGSGDMGQLAAVYEDPDKLRQLTDRPNTTARDLIDEQAGMLRWISAQATAKRMHGYATRLLADIKREHPAEAPGSTAVQVADAQYRVHHDGAACYAIILTSPQPDEHRGYAGRLQERLRGHDPECLVEMR